MEAEASLKKQLSLAVYQKRIERMQLLLDDAEEIAVLIEHPTSKKQFNEMLSVIRTAITTLSNEAKNPRNPHLPHAIAIRWQATETQFSAARAELEALLEAASESDQTIIQGLLEQIGEVYQSSLEPTLTESRVNLLNRAFQTALSKLAVLVKQEKVSVSCFLTYAPSYLSKRISQLKKDLEQAGMIVFDLWQEKDVEMFDYLDKLNTSDYVLVIGTPALKQGWQEGKKEDQRADSLRQMLKQLGNRYTKSQTGIIKLLYAGNNDRSFPAFLATLTHRDFHHGLSYYSNVLELLNEKLLTKLSSNSLEHVTSIQAAFLQQEEIILNTDEVEALVQLEHTWKATLNEAKETVRLPFDSLTLSTNASTSLWQPASESGHTYLQAHSENKEANQAPSALPSIKSRHTSEAKKEEMAKANPSAVTGISGQGHTFNNSYVVVIGNQTLVASEQSTLPIENLLPTSYPSTYTSRPHFNQETKTMESPEKITERTQKDLEGSKQEIKSLPEFFKITADTRPTDYEYALLSQHVYGGSQLKKGQVLPKRPDWKIKAVKSGKNGYFGALYFNAKTQQAVLAHQGTYSMGALMEDIQGVFLTKLSPQKHEVFVFIEEAIEFCQEMGFQLSFTGHSLGGFLAELSLYYCHRSYDFPNVNAVTFESPGCLETVESLQSNVAQGQINPHQLDIVGYLSYPNLVNTCNHHVGTLYIVEPDLGNYGWINGWHLKQVHSMDNIVLLLEKKEYIPHYIIDWPLGNQRQYFFKHAEFKEGIYALPPDSVAQTFVLDYQAHYTVDAELTNQTVLPLIHFAPALQTWLKAFYKGLWHYQTIHHFNAEKLTQQLQAYAKKEGIDELVITYLLSCSVIKQQNGMLLFSIIAPIDKTVTEIRKELSAQFDKEEALAGKLLGFVSQMGVTAKKPGEVIAEFMEEGATLEKDAEAEGKVMGTLMEFPEGASAQDIQHLKDLSDHFLKSVAETGTNVRAVGIAKGATVKGKIKLTVIGSAFSAVPRDPHVQKTDNTSAKRKAEQLSDAQLISQQRNREGLTQISSLVPEVEMSDNEQNDQTLEQFPVKK